MSVAFVCLCATAALRAQAGVPDFEFAVAWKRVATEFEAGCEQAGVVGASLAFVRGGEVSAFVHHGLADRSTGQPVDDSTIFHWASCTKSLTGIATMQLRDRGKLQLEQRGGSPVFGAYDIPATGGYQAWRTLAFKLDLREGTMRFGIKALQGGWNLNWSA